MKKLLFILPVLLMMACNSESAKKRFIGKDGEVKLMILEPGHFHAALIQKNMDTRINKEVYVYAPEGNELNSYLDLIKGYNTREDNPASWNEIVYSKDDYLNKMLSDKQGNVVVLAGNNKNKIKNISNSISAGFNILSDKPMIINKESFPLLEQAYANAAKNNLILYDLMTERYDVINIIQRQLMQNKDLFGELIKGTPDNPAIESESMHHFLKIVSGKPLIRPQWYYDVEQQGDGIADVTTHLIDQIMWKCFPDQSVNYKTDIKVSDATRWATKISLSDFQTSTNAESFPDFLRKNIINDTLNVYSNGSIQFQINDVQARINVVWNAKAIEGTGDKHKFVVKGTRADLYTLQGEKENYQSKLYIKNSGNISDSNFKKNLDNTIQKLQALFPGIQAKEAYDGMYLIDIPNELRTGHESHFQNVSDQFMRYLIDGKQPDWEVANTLSKYYITTEALAIAKRKQ